jgi:hypothetical protein
VAKLLRFAWENDPIGAEQQDQGGEVGGSLVEDGASSLTTFVDRFQRIFHGLAQEIREARRVIHENELLRQENEELREALGDCVEACGRYLAPMLEEHGDDPEQDDQVRAWEALDRARRLLDDGVPGLPGSR